MAQTKSQKSQKRQVSPLSLAFLDVMFCGFGAVILLFLILDHADTVAAVTVDPSIASEVSLLEEEVLEGALNLERIRNTVAEVSLEVVTAEGLAREIQEQIQTFMQELAALENSSTATVESIERLRADVQALEEELLRLQASALDQEGNSVRQFLGDGSRQYLTGLFLGGQRILILVDSSTSMLDETLVNIIRTRNMSDERKREAPKWQRVVRTVDWVSTQLPITSRYQLWQFSNTTDTLLDGDKFTWQEVADRDGLNVGIENMKALVPNNGTDLDQVFRAISNMDEPPDNIFLITDGLPTLGGRGKTTGLITPKDRMDLFEDAIKGLPNNVPVNVVLMPLEGDPSASAAYWQLAQITRGSFITPSKDWP
ncbi:MAG TPA: VWA domain-containing protein [Gammaproteobacteria bacterium]|jgi:polyhydroxyalkanoate synthesis regulator phasin|nr:VWA domain-containing protein [Gammaproteobacteria bacterium]